ncbi:MAG: alpha/beta fold hydrolase [Rhodospirillales bacterium]
MPEISVNGETIYYERAGQGPTLTMLHSLGTNSYLWAEQIARWQDRFTCVAFDARGHGRSTNNGGMTMQAVAEDAHAALKEMGLLPAVIMGISMGGLQCARFHALAPPDVLGIVYADSFAYLGDAGPARVKDLEDKIASMSMRDYAAAYTADTLLPATAETHHEALRQSISGMTAENYLQAVRSVFTEDVREHLKGIDKPCRIVTGEQDQRTPPAAAENVHGFVKGSSLELIPDAAHLANIDNPDGFAAAVEPFLMQFADS